MFTQEFHTALISHVNNLNATCFDVVANRSDSIHAARWGCLCSIVSPPRCFVSKAQTRHGGGPSGSSNIPPSDVAIKLGRGRSGTCLLRNAAITGQGCDVLMHETC